MFAAQTLLQSLEFQKYLKITFKAPQIALFVTATGLEPRTT